MPGQWDVLFFVAVIPWGIGLLVVIPLMVISTFVGYREVFEAKPTEGDAVTEAGP